ncbi:MAG: hypothetical protein IPN45_14795 [Actinomycetales bacterium]|nr:hypothetical protein [Actinomycetales bacterium]
MRLRRAWGDRWGAPLAGTPPRRATARGEPAYLLLGVCRAATCVGSLVSQSL